MIEAYMLILLFNCCGPNAVVSDVQDRLTDKACHERGHAFVKGGEGQGFMCLKRQYPRRK